jgi:hypothetical protein
MKWNHSVLYLVGKLYEYREEKREERSRPGERLHPDIFVERELLASIWAPITGGIPPDGALCADADGMLLWVGRSVTWAQERHLLCVTPDGPRSGPDSPRWCSVFFLLAAT